MIKKNSELDSLSYALAGNIHLIEEYFGIEFHDRGKYFVSSCPIHGGDNPTAFNLYLDGHTTPAHWKCRTRNCHSIFKSTILGLVRGLISNSKYNWPDTNKIATFYETIRTVRSLVNEKELKYSNAHRDFLSYSNILCGCNTETKSISRDVIKRKLKIPSDYFIDRGFSTDILIKYDVGDCHELGKKMNQRAVVPIYDNGYNGMIGCVGRSIYNVCGKCGYHHKPLADCFTSPKWKFDGFHPSQCLYNYWFAKKYIRQKKQVILVEGTGDLWKLEEAGIHNAVAIFGCSLSDGQQILLEKSGATDIVLLLDMNEAGRNGCDNIRHSLSRIFKIHQPQFSGDDIGEMSVDNIKSQLKEFI